MVSLYKLVDPLSLKIRYIGYTSKDIRKRLSEHLYICKKGKEKNCHRCNWINKLRKEGFRPKVYKIIEVETIEQAKRLEIELIKHYSNLFKLTNNTVGGDGISGYKHSEETKKKILVCNSRPRPESRYSVIATNRSSGEILVFKDSILAAQTLGCKPQSILSVSCGIRKAVNNWKIVLHKKC